MNSPQSTQRYQQQTMCPLPPLSKGIGNVNSISQRMDPFSFQSTSRYVSPQMAFSPQTTSTRSTTASPQSLSSQNTTFDFHSMSDPLHTFCGEVLERINAKPGAIYGQLYDEFLMVDPMWNPLAYPLPSTNGNLSPSLGEPFYFALHLALLTASTQVYLLSLGRLCRVLSSLPTSSAILAVLSSAAETSRPPSITPDRSIRTGSNPDSRRMRRQTVR